MMFVYKKASAYRAEICTPLRVLLWKYALSRLYRYCHTFWEVFGGVSLFLILFLVYHTTTDEHTQNKKSESNSTVIRVFYTPYNNFTRRLMTRVEAYLTLSDSDVLPKPQWDFESMAFPISKRILNTSNGIALVNFKNDGSFTPNLEYAISVISGQVKNNLNRVYNGFLRTITPKEEIAPHYLGALQWAIDKSFIERLTNQNIGQKVMMIAVPKYISEELRTLHKFMILCTIVAPLPFFLVHSSSLMVERRSGMRELMKLGGIYTDVLRFSHIVETLIVGFLYTIPVIIILKITSTPILPHSNFFIIFCTIVLHFVNTMSLTFITTALSQDYHHADSLGFLLYMSTFILDFLWYSYKDHIYMLYFVCCFLPHAPVYLFWDEVLYLESIGIGTQFSNIFKCHSDNAMSVTRVWLFFYIQLALITTFSWYLDLVRPGQYGVSKKWNFMFKKTYWCFKKKRRLLKVPSFQTKRDHKFFEKGHKSAKIAVQVLNVSKVFGQDGHRLIALDSVTFDCYKGEVTMVMGTNGAGKTTLMHIVTGMISATEGAVYVNGVDVAHKLIELREDVGLCMQQNVSFRFLTVKENITFFKMLTRNPKEGLHVDQLLKKLKLTEVADLYSPQLCTGNLRCLQVACVLVGDADVLVLDEPTTGMDVEVRHRLWDLIMVLRGKKTVLMSTSCLEEANALGDKIVILNDGLLKCHGSPTFLKHAIGTSFNLTITIKDGSRMVHLMAMVDKIIPKLKCRIHDMRRIIFSLPSKEFQKFPELFRALEGKKQEFGIILMDVGMFMEDVFSRFIDISDADPYALHPASSYLHYRAHRIVGIKLIFKQVKLLHKRVYSYLLVKKFQFLFMRILVPLVCLLVVTLTTNYSLRHDKIFSHQISSQHLADITKIVYNVAPFKRRALFHGIYKYPGVKPVYALDIDRDFSGPSSGYMNRKTIGFKITDNYTKIFHPQDPLVTSKSVNMYSNIYLSIFMPYLNNTILTTYETLSRSHIDKIKDPKSNFLCIKWSTWVTFLAILPLTPIIILCIVERNCGIRDNHMMAGCTPIVHWGSKLLAHITIFMVITIVPVILIAILLDFDKTFAQAKFLGSVFALLLMFGLAFLSYLYVMSYMLNKNYAISEIYIVSIFFGVILPILLAVLEPVWDTSIYVAIPYFIIVAVGRINPIFPFGVGLGRLTLQARLNAFCFFNKRLCPNLGLDDEGFSPEVCCESSSYEPFPYLVSYNSGLFDMINLVLNFIIFSTLIILLEYRIPQYLYEQFTLNNYKKPAQVVNDPSVIQEKDYVQTAIRNRDFTTDAIIVDNIHKDYASEIRKTHTFNAVKGISFTTKLGECLAILGPQATGKSSLLNMLAGNLVMTRGNACIDGMHIRANRMKYIHKISLLASTGGLDGFMTGYQNLMFLAKIKGYPDKMARRLSQKALRCLGLQASPTKVSQYSSGCLRRLVLCSTLVLAPRVAFLDEPMREIDASTKPLVAKVLQKLMLEPTALIVAETSADWRLLQPVFTRIAIMSKGQFAAIGPAEEILKSVAKGFTAQIKLKMVTAYRRDRYRYEDDDSSDSDSEAEDLTIHSAKSVMYAHRVVQFKNDFLKAFDTSRITGEHLTVIYFYIDDEQKTQLYSDMFMKLQELKEKYDDVVEDYYLCATTIEDVFWRLEHEAPENVTAITPPKTS